MAGKFLGDRFGKAGGVDHSPERPLPRAGPAYPDPVDRIDPAAPRSMHRYLYADADPVNRVDPDGRMSMPEISVVSQIMAGLAVAKAFADFGGDVYRGKAAGAAALGAAQTLAVDLLMIGAGEAVGAVVLGPLLRFAGKTLGPLVGNLTKPLGSGLGAAGSALSRQGLIEYGRSMKTLLELYGKYSGTLAKLAGGTLKPGLEAEAKIALGTIRSEVINMNRKIAPEVTKELIKRLRLLRDASYELILEEAPEEFAKMSVGKGWTLFVDTVLGVL